ncbi:MAG: hypothetical protein QOE31_3618, partial [Solirubrobacteraceae bacterium]|nr:hypothetical protein [Solirubrobacteraceae bacterium]
NPGSMRWMGEMASGLAQAGLLERYLTTLAGTPELERRLARLPQVGAYAAGQARLRRLPPDVARDRAIGVGLPSYVASTALARAVHAPAIVQAANARHQELFDRAAARRLGPDCRAVIAASTAARRTLARARRSGAVAILDYPIAHHNVVDRLMADEARLQPRFANTLQYLARSPRRRRMLDAEIASADSIIVLSSFAYRSFVDAGVAEEKLELIALGVDLEMFTPAQRTQDEPFRVLFAGQISQRKGISYLLEGYRRAALPRSELVFLGRPVGPSSAWISQPGVVHWPPVAIYDLRSRYVACDVYVLPSLAEGFPQTAIIAMACGLPVIVSEHTFGSDVVTDGVDGYVVAIRDPDAIAERLRALAADPELRRRMGAAARQTAQRFAWSSYRRSIGELARRLVGDGPAAGE